MEKMLDLFKERVEIKDMAEVTQLKVTEGRIEFDGVGFQYDKRRETVRNISFKVEPGTTTAFVGASGGGKTTIGRLLFRFYDPNEGSISIDGINIRSVTLNSLRESIGIF
jgi:ATP-binding cassette subfamily B protein